MSAFGVLQTRAGLLFSLEEGPFRIELRGWEGAAQFATGAGVTTFGLVTEDSTGLAADGAHFTSRAGTYFVTPEPFQMVSGRGVGIVVHGYSGLRQLGGPIEQTGRLRYIDGCSDTLLVSPPRRGEPCLNHLHVPPRTRQSAHSHASVRLGVIVRGEGRCHTPGGTVELRPGMAWCIPAGLRHHFSTTDQALDVLAWHPDSDFGPTDENHPMINRTLLES